MLPRGKRPIGCKWVFVIKDDVPDSKVSRGMRHKARLVAKRDTHMEGVDYNEVFSLVVKRTSICVLFSLVAQYNLELEQLDVKIAFMYEE